MTRRVTYAEAGEPATVGWVQLPDGCLFYQSEPLFLDWKASGDADVLVLEVELDESGKRTKLLKPMNLAPHAG